MSSRDYWAVRVTFYDDDRPVEHWFRTFEGEVPIYTLLTRSRFEFADNEEAHRVRQGIKKLDPALDPKVVHVRVVPR